MNIDWSVKFQGFWTRFWDKGGYKDVVIGLKNTGIIAVGGLIIGVIIGTLIAIIKVIPKTNKLLSFLDKLATLYVGFFRGTPMVVQLLLGYYVLLPMLGINTDPIIASLIIFGLNSGAYVSEIMRSGILSVDPGQMEAGRALGMGYGTTMMRIIVPQAVKNILPTIGNEFISLIKETSVVSFVGAVDLYKAFRSIATANYEYMVPFLAMALIYIVVVLVISMLVKIMEKRLRASDKR